MLARHIFALNFITTSMWAESMFAHLSCHNICDVRKVSSVDQAVIDLVESVSIRGVPGLEVDLFVNEVSTLIEICLPNITQIEWKI
jgi:hypothetical protein